MVNPGRILLADDEDTFLQSTADLLRDVGYECDCVNDSMAARECLSKEDYDLLISDINMPGNVQLEFLKELYQQDQFLPLIVITGYPSVNTAVDSFRLAAVDYLQKPIDIQELVGLVKKATQRKHFLRSIRRTRHEMQTLTDALEHLETSDLSSRLGRENQTQGMALGAYFEHVVGHLASVSVGLKSTIDQVKGEGLESEPRDMPQSFCPACAQYRETLYQTMQVLAKTKDTFKSKPLGALRRHIRNVLDQNWGRLPISSFSGEIRKYDEEHGGNQTI